MKHSREGCFFIFAKIRKRDYNNRNYDNYNYSNYDYCNLNY